MDDVELNIPDRCIDDLHAGGSNGTVGSPPPPPPPSPSSSNGSNGSSCLTLAGAIDEGSAAAAADAAATPNTKASKDGGDDPPDERLPFAIVGRTGRLIQRCRDAHTAFDVARQLCFDDQSHVFVHVVNMAATQYDEAVITTIQVPQVIGDGGQPARLIEMNPECRPSPGFPDYYREACSSTPFHAHLKPVGDKKSGARREAS